MKVHMDWPQIIRDLQATNLSQQEIATLCGTSQPNIAELLSGKIKTPRYDTGAALVLAHRRRVKAEA